jgi:hypothetical protein
MQKIRQLPLAIRVAGLRPASWLLALGLMSSPAWADTTFQAAAGADDYNDFAPGMAQNYTSNVPVTAAAAAGGNSGGAYATDTSGGTVFATATSQYNGVADGSSLITYRVVLEGNPAVGPVPINVSAGGHAAAATVPSGSPYGAYSTATAEFELLFPTSSLISVASVTCGLSCIGNPTLSFDQSFTMIAGVYFDVVMSAAASSGGGSLDPGYAEAFVDPEFTIDPAYAAGFHFEGIPGVVPVPEPMTAALFALGLLAVAGAARRRAG